MIGTWRKRDFPPKVGTFHFSRRPSLDPMHPLLTLCPLCCSVAAMNTPSVPPQTTTSYTGPAAAVTSLCDPCDGGRESASPSILAPGGRVRMTVGPLRSGSCLWLRSAWQTEVIITESRSTPGSVAVGGRPKRLRYQRINLRPPSNRLYGH